MQSPWTHVLVSQLPKGLLPLSLSSHPLTVSRIGAGTSLHLCHPPTSKPPAAEVSSSLVLCVHSCYPSAYSPHRNLGKPLEMYDIVLIFCLNLPVEDFYLTHCTKHFSSPRELAKHAQAPGHQICFQALFCAFIKMHNSLFFKNEIMLCIIACFFKMTTNHTGSCGSQSRLLALLCPTTPRESINPRRKKTALLTLVPPVPRTISGTKKGEKAELERPTECRNSAFFWSRPCTDKGVKSY